MLMSKFVFNFNPMSSLITVNDVPIFHISNVINIILPKKLIKVLIGAKNFVLWSIAFFSIYFN